MQNQDQARIRWGCRRGLKELDLLLLPFVDEKYATLSVAEQQSFAELLETPDPELYSWLIAYNTPPKPDFKSLCEKIHAFHQSQH